MKDYKPLGEYIRQVDVRNKDRKVERLLGVNLQKEFMPSVANIVGTDMSTYKIINYEQFGCKLMSVGRDGKLPISLYKEKSPALISGAYYVFEVKDKSVLLPDFLFLLIKRPQFDRQLWFYSGADVRGGTSWDCLCDMPISVPPLAEQRRIVERYASVSRRIACLRRLIATLEDTARTIYRHTFVDGINKEQLPEGWRMGRLTDIAEYFNGAACQNFGVKDNEDSLPVLKIRELGQGFCDGGSDRVSNTTLPQKYIIHNNDIVFSWSATLMIDYWEGGECALNQHLFKVTPINVPYWFAFLSTSSHIQEWKRLISAKATSMGHIKREDLDNALVALPPNALMLLVDKNLTPLMAYNQSLKREVNILLRLQSLLLTRLSQ